MVSRLALFAILLAIAMVQATDLSRGFSDKIKWVAGLDQVSVPCWNRLPHTFQETHPKPQAKEIAKQEGKPIVVLVHKTWCGACKQLKKDFQSGSAGVQRVIKSSADYVMVNLEDDESEGKPELQPEGAGYIPRVVFFTPDGTPRPDVKSAANPSYAYFYPTADSLGQVMESALSSLKKTASEL
jgi:thiol:disulfide interchange protein